MPSKWGPGLGPGWVGVTGRFITDFSFQVSVPSTGQLALDIMCGAWGASRCSAAKWFFYMGDAADNFYVPFQITYLPQPDTSPLPNGITPHDPKIIPCHEAIDVSRATAHFALRF